MGHRNTSTSRELCRLFPADAGRIEALAEHDDRFAAICDDIGEAAKAKVRWESNNKGQSWRAAEYKRMVEELCEEALDYLNKSSHPGKSP